MGILLNAAKLTGPTGMKETDAIRKVVVGNIVAVMDDLFSQEISDADILNILLFISNMDAIDKSVFELLEEARAVVNESDDNVAKTGS